MGKNEKSGRFNDLTKKIIDKLQYDVVEVLLDKNENIEETIELIILNKIALDKQAVQDCIKTHGVGKNLHGISSWSDIRHRYEKLLKIIDSTMAEE